MVKIMEPIQKLQAAMPEGMDAAFIFSEVNCRYFTGFVTTDDVLVVTRGHACLYADSRYVEAARAGVRGCEVRLLTDMNAQLRDAAAEFGIRTAGFESRRLPYSAAVRLQKTLPGVAFDTGDALSDVIDGLRMIKAPEEIAKIEKAQEITDAAYRHILELIRPGVTERELALEIEYFMKKNGASGPSFDLIVVSGENSSLPHGVPGDRRLREGDFITMDTGAVVDGYCSDMTRTVALGKADPEMKKVYDTVLKAQLAAEQAIRAGEDCGGIDRVARSLIDGAGYKGCFGHGLGHSVGLEIHESPRFSPACHTVLREGMIMTVEPGIYLEGRFGVRIEDLVAVTADGCRIFTKSPKELTVL